MLTCSPRPGNKGLEASLTVVSPDTTYVKKVDCCSVEKVVSQLLVSSKEL